MLYQITDGTVSLGGETVLNHFDFEIRGTEKIAVVGRNGAGKTTLLRLLAGELELDRDDKRAGEGIHRSRQLTVGMLRQQPFSDRSRTVEEELLAACPCRDTYDRERFMYEQEYDRLLTGFGLSKEDKKRRIDSFSGGEQTKLGLIRLLLAAPDILILDEPTNHLDLETVQWLEQYLKTYKKAVVMVSHDRFFLDRTAEVVYELENGKLRRYKGNYTYYRQEKQKELKRQQKAYERQKQEEQRLSQLVERFKNKPRKAAFARAKKNLLQKMPELEKPREDDVHLFTGPIDPLIPGSKWVLEAEHLKIGYEKPLLELSLRIRRGQKVGILGANGAGKTTFLKTAAGFLPPVSGTYTLGNQVVIGYFDQHSAEISSDQTVLEHFHGLYPALTEKDARTVLGAYLFGGREAAKKVNSLSGGEKARLVLAEILQARPNFLILDEPTNHMDIQAKETLESAFQAYSGTILFVSHDRYFLDQVADSMLIFEQNTAMYYPFGYSHYLERLEKQRYGQEPAAQIRAEDQALIAGIRAVPRAERHRLREIPTEEAYQDWKTRLAAEAMEAARRQAETCWEAMEEMAGQWKDSEGFWNGEEWPEAAEYQEKQRQYETYLEKWGECCKEWAEYAGCFSNDYR